jgi:PleD family two-component response regulator
MPKDIEDLKPHNSDALPESGKLSERETEIKPSLHSSLTSTRTVLVVDEEGQRRDETMAIVEKILIKADVEAANDPEEALSKMGKKHYDTYVINLLMPGYSSSEFVKAVHNHSSHPLMVGFSADKMSDAYDPKKGIKIKPLRKLFEISSFKKEGDETEDL